MTRQQHTTRSQMPRWSFVGFWGAFREALEGKQLIPGSFNAQWALKKRRKKCKCNKILIKKTEMAKKTFLDVIFCTSGINLKISKRPENTIIILVYLLSKSFPFFQFDLCWKLHFKVFKTSFNENMAHCVQWSAQNEAMPSSVRHSWLTWLLYCLVVFQLLKNLCLTHIKRAKMMIARSCTTNWLCLVEMNW